MPKNIKDKTKKKAGKNSYSGPIRDKSRTKSQLIEAVGKVIEKKGYTALNGPNIAKEAGVHKKLIWTYFGSIDNLVEEFLQQRDFWRVAEKKVAQKFQNPAPDMGENEIYKLLESQFKTLLNDGLLRKIIHWELEGENETLRKIADQREAFGERIFKILDVEYADSDRDIRANLALQIAGIYYLTLHAKSNGSTFCGIDVNTKEGEERILRGLEDMLKFTFREK